MGQGSAVRELDWHQKPREIFPECRLGHSGSRKMGVEMRPDRSETYPIWDLTNLLKEVETPPRPNPGFIPGSLQIVTVC